MDRSNRSGSGKDCTRLPLVVSIDGRSTLCDWTIWKCDDSLCYSEKQESELPDFGSVPLLPWLMLLDFQPQISAVLFRLLLASGKCPCLLSQHPAQFSIWVYTLHWHSGLVWLFSPVLGIEPRALHMLDEHSATSLFLRKFSNLEALHTASWLSVRMTHDA